MPATDEEVERSGDPSWRRGVLDTGKGTKALPEEMWMLIHAQLPLPDLARARCVCRSWKAIWHNPGFRQLMHQTSLKEPWGVYFPIVRHNDLVLGFDTFSGRQQRLPPVTFGSAREERVSASRGLLCGCDYFWLSSGKDLESETLIVIANPLTNARMELPPLRLALVSIVWFRVRNEDHQGTAAFAVCVSGWTEEEVDSLDEAATANVYLSWRPEHAWHTIKIPADQGLCNFVVLNRKIYFLFRHEITLKEVLAEYDPEVEDWGSNQVSPPDGFAWLEWIVECGGVLYGIGVHSSESFHLLRLDPTASTEWELVRRFPDMQCDVHPEGCPLVAVRDAVVTQTGRLCITFEHRDPSRCKVLVYENVLSDRDEITWHTLPSDVYERNSTIAVFGAYEPSFASFS